MLSVDDALAICRAFASLQTEYMIEWENTLAQATERLLVEVQLARDEADHYRAQLKEWGIPAKRRTIAKRAGGGFEAGWA